MAKKRKAPKIFRDVRACMVEVGARPFTKLTPSQKRAFNECLERRKGRA